MSGLVIRGLAAIGAAAVVAVGLAGQGQREPEPAAVSAPVVSPTPPARATPPPERLERLPPGVPKGSFTVRGGKPVAPETFSAMLYFTKTGLCSGTLVGERSLITARHCVVDQGWINVPKRVGSDARVDGKCEHATTDDGSLGPDLALCLLDAPVVAQFERLNKDPMRPAPKQKILLAGFGCAEFGQTDPKPTFRVGDSWVDGATSGASPVIRATGGAALCLGDSGGAAFLVFGSRRVQIAVNSQVDADDASDLPSVTAPAALAFIRKWADKHKQRLCGLDPLATGCRP